MFGGAQIGNIFGSFMSGFLMAGDGDWANVFYFFGCFGILWFIFWVSIEKYFIVYLTFIKVYNHLGQPLFIISYIVVNFRT